MLLSLLLLFPPPNRTRRKRPPKSSEECRIGLFLFLSLLIFLRVFPEQESCHGQPASAAPIGITKLFNFTSLPLSTITTTAATTTIYYSTTTHQVSSSSFLFLLAAAAIECPPVYLCKSTVQLQLLTSF